MEVADLVAKFSAEGDERVIRSVNRLDSAIDHAGETGVRAGRGIGTVFQVAGGFLAAQAVSGIFNAAKGLIGVQASAEQAHIALETVVGSTEKANALFKDVQAFAAATPFQFPELLDATIQMEAFGLNSTKWLTTVGDTAAAMNKSVDSVVQAVLDASTGEYERLKELGIKARIEGDKVSFSYMKNGQQIVQTVDKNNAEVVQSTIQAIWNDKYAGAMEKQSKTFAGQMSTLKDNISLAMQSATASVFQFATKGLAFVNDIFANGFMATIQDRFGTGAAEFVGHLATMAQGVIDAFGEGTPVADLVAKLPESWRPVGDAIFRAADAIGQLATNIRQGDWSGAANDLKQLAEAGVRLGGALGQSLIPKIQHFLDTNRLSGFTAAIRIDAFQPVFDAAAKGDIEKALTQLFEVDPIKITPKIELNIRESIANAIGGVGGIGGGGGGGDDFGIKDTIQGILDNIGIGGVITKWIGEKVGPDALRAGRAIVEGIAEGIVIRAASTDWIGSLLTSGQDVINGMQTGAAEQWASFDSWLNSRDDAAFAAVGELSATLVTPGLQLIEGLWQGAGDQWDSFTNWLAGLGTDAASWVGDLGGYLYNAGIDLVQGLIDGVMDRIPGLQSAVGLINSIIDQIDRGHSPWPMMIEAGADAIDGLMIGMRNRHRALVSAVGSTNAITAGLGGSASNSPRLQPRFSGGGHGGGTTVIDLRGALIGRGAEAEIRRIVAESGATVIDRRAGTAALAGARR